MAEKHSPKQRIIESAYGIILRASVGDLRCQQIGEETNYAVSNVLYHFSSKEGIVKEVLKEIIDRVHRHKCRLQDFLVLLKITLHYRCRKSPYAKEVSFIVREIMRKASDQSCGELLHEILRMCDPCLLKNENYYAHLDQDIEVFVHED